MNVLIIGLGSIARKHIAAIRRLVPEVHITALRRADSVFIEENGISSVLDIRGLAQMDFVIVSNPTHKHAETIAELVSLNVPLFIEKPLFSDLKQEALMKQIPLHNIKTYVACNLRFLDSLNFVKDFLVPKRINEVNVYCGSYLPSWRPGVDYRTVYSANREMGGGVHIDLIHEIDYMIWLFGFPLEARKVFASNSSLDIDAYDYANYLFSYPEFSVGMVLNYYRRSAKRTLEVICDDGECLVNLLNNEVYWNGKSVFASEQRIADTYDRQMQYFLQRVLASDTMDYFNQMNEAYKILNICLEG